MDETKRYFKDVSEKWSTRYQGQPNSIWDLDLMLRRENVHRILAPMLEANSDRKLEVLDVGCGTGDALEGISRDCVSVMGFDMVQEMVDVAAQNHPEDTYLVEDILSLPLEEKGRDLVLCLGVLEYVDDPQAALEGMRRELREGGRVVVSFPNNKCILRHVTRLLEKAEDIAATTIRRLQGRKRNTAPNSYRHISWTPETVSQMLSASGLDTKNVYFNTFGVGGRLGKLKIVMGLSRWLTHRLYNSRNLGERFGMTMVFEAASKT